MQNYDHKRAAKNNSAIIFSLIGQHHFQSQGKLTITYQQTESIDF